MDSRKRKAVRVLLIGPMPPPVGGSTVLFQQLTRELPTVRDIALRVVSTSRGRRARRLGFQAAIVVYKILRNICASDVVSFHSSRQGAVFFGPIVFVLSHAFRKPWIFRGFGDFESWHKSAGFLNKALFRFAALQADIVLFETKSSVAYFRMITSHDVRWYSNSRPFASNASQYNSRGDDQLRFVYVGHVKPSKGVHELIQAAQLFDGVTVDVYGPLLEGIDDADFRGKNARYCGELEPSEVPNVLRRYDVLLFPTFYEGEGYPGVILEAFAQGLPVIATRWRSIPEIVTSQNGMLIEPRSVTELAAAMRQFVASRESFQRLRDGTQYSAKLFSSESWTQYFVDMARELQEGAARKAGI